MSTAFELQIYQNGQWQFDSYFDDRETVISEAERMNSTGRYAGVRILEESYKPNSNTCKYHVIYSRLGKDSSPEGNWREKIQAEQSGARLDDLERIHRLRSPEQRAPRPSPKGKAPPKKTSPVTLIILATFLVLTGIAVIIGLRSYAGIS